MTRPPLSPYFAAVLLTALAATAAAQDDTVPPPVPILAIEPDDALDTSVDATQPPPPESAPLTDTDDGFIDVALAAGRKEVAAAALARSRGADEEIRELGAMLEADHRRSNDELVALRAGTTSPTSTVDPAVADSGIADLEAMASAEFDGAWLQWQAAAHANAIALFERTAGRDAHSDAVRLFAQTTLPTLRAHAERIAALRRDRAPRVVDDAD